MLCMIAKLSEEATQTLRSVQKIVPGAAGRPLHGHITIAAYTGADEAQFIRFCKELAGEFSAFSVEYEGLRVLEETSIIVAAPKRAGPLEALHRGIAEKYRDTLDIWTGTKRWMPHTTLFFGPGEDLDEICRRMGKGFAPFSARISGIEFSRIEDSGYKIVDRLDFPEEGRRSC